MHQPSTRTRATARDIDDVEHWLVDRESTCADEIVEWMVRSTSLSTETLAARWADRDWAWALSDLIIEAVDDRSHSHGHGHGKAPVRGFLRGVSAGRGIGILTLDGTTRWISRARWIIVHPAQLAQIGAWRALADEAGIAQHVDQLYRSVHVRDRRVHRDSDTAAVLGLGPHGIPLQAKSSEESHQLIARNESFWQDGTWLVARLSGAASAPALSFHDIDGRAVHLAAVSPVVWSEAVRLAA